MRLLLLFLVGSFATGCAHDLKFQSFGTYRPEFEQKVADGYHSDKSMGPGESEVTVYSATFPAGIIVKDGVVTTAPDSERVVLGTFEWAQGLAAPAEKDAPREFGKIAIAAGGNEIVLMELKADRGYVRSARGVVIKYTPAGKTAPEAGTTKL